MMRVETVDDAMIYRIERLEISLTNRFFKRMFDIILSVVGLVISIPFFYHYTYFNEVD